MPRESITIGPAQPGDLAAILALLEGNGLPTAGLAAQIDGMLVARDENKVVGSAALEIYGSEALLRSVAVDESLRGQGWGVRLTQAALEHATRLGIREVYLLTETAGEFFPRFGFRAIARSLVPENVRQSVEFVSACPESAMVMAWRTKDEGRGTKA